MKYFIKYKITFTFSLFVALQLGFLGLPIQHIKAQPPSFLTPSKQKADTFAFSIRQVWDETNEKGKKGKKNKKNKKGKKSKEKNQQKGKEKLQKKDLKPMRQYDFEAQYPYYKIEGKDWEVGQGLQINLHTLPDTGHLYLFSVDAMEEVNILFASTVDAKVLLPDSTHSFNIEFAGVERLCFWYSLSPIPHYERLAKGLEMTMGRFMQRNAAQLGRSLLLPQNSWHLLENQFGCRITDSKKITPKDIIPIVVELNILPTKK